MLMKGGTVEEAFWDLTGCPTEALEVENSWNIIKSSLMEGDIVVAVT